MSTLTIKHQGGYVADIVVYKVSEEFGTERIHSQQMTLGRRYNFTVPDSEVREVEKEEPGVFGDRPEMVKATVNYTWSFGIDVEGSMLGNRDSEVELKGSGKGNAEYQLTGTTCQPSLKRIV